MQSNRELVDEMVAEALPAWDPNIWIPSRRGSEARTWPYMRVSN